MALNYRIIPNPLTVEPSYRADVVQNIIGLDDIVNELAVIIPQVGSSTIRLVITELRDVIEQRLTDGYTVRLDDFVRFFHSIPGRLESSDSTVSSESVKFNAAISTSIDSRVRQSIGLSRSPFQEKSPSLSYVSDASGNVNFLGQMLIIKGDGLDFNPISSDEGVFIVNTHTGVGVKPSQYALVTNSQTIALNDAVTTPVATQYNEYLVTESVRYTTNGSLRTGTYLVPTRYYRQIVDDEDIIDNNVIFYSKYSGTEYDFVSVDSVTYDNSLAGTYQFSIKFVTNLTGVIREDSRFSVIVVDTLHDVNWTYQFDTYVSGAYITSITLDALSIQNAGADDEIVELVLSIPDISEFWKNINFQYKGAITEIINWQYIPPVGP